MTSKEIFYRDMNALADAINAKAGLTGKKTLTELKQVVESLVVVQNNRNVETTENNTEEESTESVENRR